MQTQNKLGDDYRANLNNISSSGLTNAKTKFNVLREHIITKPAAEPLWLNECYYFV